MFCTKFKLSADLTVIESYNGFGIYLTSLSKMTCGIVLNLSNVQTIRNFGDCTELIFVFV